MNHCVPDYEVEDDYSLPASSELSRLRKSSMALDEVMELLWQNGQVVMQSQNQRSVRRSPPPKANETAIPPNEIREEDQHLFVQEDEMASWLHYPLADDSSLDNTFGCDLLYSAPSQYINHNTDTNASVTATMAARPPIGRTESEANEHNIVHFARHGRAVKSGSSSKKSVVLDLTVVDSSDTPSVRPESMASEMVRPSVAEPSKNNGDLGRGTVTSCTPAGTSAGFGAGAAGKEIMTCEVTVTSSPGDSSASAGPITDKLVSDDRKRKGRGADETECHSEDIDFESGDAKKQVRGSTSNKRARAAEVHNLSERRRRDRINEKMRALQELIPRCNKSDKASMLDEAIEYLKSLQLQVQMMSMGCGMVPMMFPGVQSYIPPMGMGMGMAMGMEMGLNRPMMPFPNMLPGSVLPTHAGASGPRFPMPSFHTPIPPRTDPSRPLDHRLNMLGTQAMNQPRVPNFLDAYPQFLAPHPMQMPSTQIPQQKQAVTQVSPSKPCSSRRQEKS